MNKRLKQGIALAVIIFLLVVMFSIFYKSKDKIIKKVDRNLGEQQKSGIDNNLNEIDNQILKINEGTPKDEIYSLYIQQGHEYYQLGDYASQRNSYLKASEIDPQNPDVWAQLFQVNLDMKDYKNAKVSIDKSLTLNPSNPALWLSQISFEKQYLSVTDDRVNNLYTQALSKNPNSILLIQPYAQFLEQAGNLQAAKEYWQKAIVANPSSKSVYEQEIERIEKLQGTRE